MKPNKLELTLQSLTKAEQRRFFQFLNSPFSISARI